MWCTSTQPASARRPETRWRFHLSRCPGFGVHFYQHTQVYRFRLSEGGFWWLEAECDGEVRTLVPPVVRVDESSDGQLLDATLAPIDR